MAIVETNQSHPGTLPRTATVDVMPGGELYPELKLARKMDSTAIRAKFG
jgi:hypothetical protein